MPPRPDTDAPPLAAALRAATADLHERVETAMPVLDPAFTRADYGRLLARLAAFHAVAEPALDRWAPALRARGIELGERRKLPLLRRDLAALGVTPDAALDALDALDAPDAPDAVADAIAGTLGRAFGALYVLEGATLGGQVIRRRLVETLGLTPDAGCAYFASYGPEVGARWTAFRRALDAFGERDARPGAARAAVVAGARATFLLFERVVVAAPAGAPAGAAAAAP